MDKIAIVYASKYGSTAQYANWLKEMTNGDLYTNKDVTMDKLSSYDTIIFGSGTYAGKLPVTSFIKDNFNALKDKHLILYTTGMTPIGNPNRQETLNSNLSPDIQKDMKIFELNGESDPSKVKGLAKIILKIGQKSHASDTNTFSKEALNPMIEYINTLK